MVQKKFQYVLEGLHTEMNRSVQPPKKNKLSESIVIKESEKNGNCDGTNELIVRALLLVNKQFGCWFKYLIFRCLRMQRMETQPKLITLTMLKNLELVLKKEAEGHGGSI